MREIFKAEDVLEKLRLAHDEIKSHRFREIFYDEFAVGWKAGLRDYSSKIYKLTELLCDLAYRTEEYKHLQPDMWWVHNFRSDYSIVNAILEQKSYHIKRMELQSKTNLSTVGDLMVHWDKFISYLHRFLDTNEFTNCVHIDYELEAIPHNGYYFYHSAEYAKINGKWVLTKPINYVKKGYLEAIEKYRESRRRGD